jgi:hypothetical protein
VVALGGWHAAQAASADEVPMNTPNRPEGWVRGCTGKWGFKSHGHAQRVAKRMRQNREAVIVPYHCKHCGHFHVGTSDDRNDRRERSRRRKAAE